MGRRHRVQGAVRDDALTVHRGPARSETDRPRRATGPIDRGDALSDGCEAAEPEDYGVRVAWQPEEVRIEAAEFLLATRIEHEARLRATAEIEHRTHADG